MSYHVAPLAEGPIILPADVYDTLEFSALVYGGIGGGHLNDAHGACCLLGHADWAGSLSGLQDNPLIPLLYEAFGEAIQRPSLPSVSDQAVKRINMRKDRWLLERVTWEEFTAELNIVRGE